jgi:GNAT superfamily N-acetyltransferase
MSTSFVEVARSASVSPQQSREARVRGHCFEEDLFAESLDFGLAIDRDALEQAFRLQHDQYVAQGYMDPHPTGLRLNIHSALPSTRVFVAKADRRVVGTMTLIVDSQLGLPMDQIYAEDLGGIRGERHQLTEASGLALDPDCQRSGVAILMRLIRLITLYAAEVLRSSDICIAVNPRHAAFYRKALYFQDFGAMKQYAKVNGAPAVGLRLDCDLLRMLVREEREGRPVASQVYSFLYRKAEVERALSRLIHDQARAFQPEHFSYFFSEHESWTTAAADHRAFLMESYRRLASGGVQNDGPDAASIDLVAYDGRKDLALA